MTIWIDEISIPSFFFLLTTKDFYCCTAIKYFEGSRLAVLLVRLTKIHHQKFRIEKVEYSLGDMEDEQGICLRFPIEEDVDRINQAIAENFFQHLRLLSKKPFKTLPKIWLVRYFSHEISNTVRQHAIYISVFSYLTKNVGSQDQKNANAIDRFYLRYTPFNEYILQGGQYNQHNVIEYLRILGKFKLYLLPGLLVFICVSIFVLNVLMNIWLRFVRKGNTSKKYKKAMVGVQYCWGHDIQKRSDIYWFKGSGISTDRVIFYFDRPDTVLTKELRLDLEKLGFKNIICPDKHLISCFLRNPLAFFSRNKTTGIRIGEYCWHPSNAFSLDLLKGIFFIFGSAVSSVDFRHFNQYLWVVAISLKLYFEMMYWRAFFMDHNMKVHMNHTGDIGSRHTAHTLAMHLSGGINVRSNYSYIQFYDPRYSREFHVYFSWGKQPACSRAIERIYSCYNIYSGYIFDYLFHIFKESADFNLHEKVNFIIALYDENFAPNCNYSYNNVKRYYNAFFDFVLQNDHIGLIIKSKIYTFEYLKGFVPKLVTAFKTGRIVYMDSSDSPYEAVRHADIAVGLGHNSAGIEAALYGAPVIYWVPDAHVCNQLEGNLRSRLIFHDLDELLESLLDLIKGKIHKSAIGDHSDIIDEIDPWRDGHAGKRVGKYIKWFVDALDNGRSREIALKHANASYAERWGIDKVIENPICFD